jgi:hypothetical protein
VRLDLIVDELPVPLQRRRFHLDRAESRVKILPQRRLAWIDCRSGVALAQQFG